MLDNPAHIYYDPQYLALACSMTLPDLSLYEILPGMVGVAICLPRGVDASLAPRFLGVRGVLGVLGV